MKKHRSGFSGTAVISGSQATGGVGAAARKARTEDKVLLSC